MALAGSVSLGKFFARNGPLQTAHSGYEYRPGQIEMATAVAEALEERRHLFIEAGTGTGKTLAYLLPVLQSGRRVLLSTGTRNLQEQLVTKDVPLLASALGQELTVICMKGRQNYACKQKISDFHSQPGLLERDEYDMLTRIRTWAAETETGDQAELDFLPENHPLWQRLNARRETCTGQKCPLYDSCFLTSLHQRAAAADMVVVNHHLFFADLRLKGQDLAGVLPPYEAVVFDEAHELETIAGQYFGIGVSSHQIEDLARDASAHLKMLDLASPDMDARIEYVRMAAQKFFLCFGAREGRTVFEERPQFVQDHAEVYDQYMGSLAYLQSGLDAIHDKPEEVHNLMRRAGDLRQQTAYIVESEDEGVVYWVERRGRGVHLQASPIEVAALLRDQLFNRTDTVVMTSATLAVSGGFEYVRGRLGVEHARERVVASPFEYARQALLYLPRDLPEPNSAGYRERAVEEIADLLEASQGRAFVLCTSRAQMKLFHAAMAGRVKFPLLLQGESPRNLLLEKFRQTPGAVLFATSSFWQGVDVQGEQLSCVIIDRLPFAVPSDPLVAARMNALAAQGKNAFREFQVPEAVLALKQGFGRLIRSSRDRGVVALLDSRVLSKSYGRQFLDSLPDFALTRDIAEVREFFSVAASGASPRV